MVKNHNMARFEWRAFCLFTSWFSIIIYIGSTDVDAHEKV